jgi:transcriptional regulator with XRE-family HTH domain
MSLQNGRPLTWQLFKVERTSKASIAHLKTNHHRKGTSEVNTIGKRVRHAREQKGMSQAELARTVDIAPSSMHLLETRKGGSSHMFALAQALDVNIEWLATGKGPMRKRSEKLARLAPQLLAILKEAIAAHSHNNNEPEWITKARSIVERADD